jgi:DNA mismatch repair protein MutS2
MEGRNLMNDKTIRMLEYKKIIELLSKKAITDNGKEKCDTLMPSSNIKMIDKKLKETSEAVSLSLRIGNPPLIKLADFKAIATKIRIGAILSIKELLNTATIFSQTILKKSLTLSKNDPASLAS